MSFIDNINALKVRLENNAALNAYAVNNYGKVFKVMKVYKNRVEIQLSDLPIIMITRPSVRRTPGNLSSRKDHSVSLYAGFRQEDRETSLEQFIELDELLEAAVIAKTALFGDVPMSVEVNDSLNDEGMYHPSYFLAMNLTVKTK